MNDLYVLALYNADGEFESYVRKGRNNSIVGYDSLDSAERGARHTKRSNVRVQQSGYIVMIIKFSGDSGEVVIE